MRQEYYSRHKEEINKKRRNKYSANREKILAQVKKHCLMHKDDINRKRRERYSKTKEKILTRNKQYRLNHKDEINRKCREKYQKNKTKILTQQKQYYLKNRDKKLVYAKEYRNRPEIKMYVRTPEYKSIRSKNQKKHIVHRRLAQHELRRKKVEQDSDYWKKMYLKYREQLNAYSRAYSKTPKAKEQARRYHANPKIKERDRLYTQMWRKTPQGRLSTQVLNERRRVRLLGLPHTLTKEEWLKIRDQTKGICPICNRDVGLEKMSIDHIVPITKRGGHVASNIRAICRSCNSRLGNRGFIWEMDSQTKTLVKVYR